MKRYLTIPRTGGVLGSRCQRRDRHSRQVGTCAGYGDVCCVENEYSDAQCDRRRLGLITQDVKDVLAKLELPGMKVRLFAFNDDPARNPYVPHNVSANSVIYTGTHDNNTIMGWWKTEAQPFARENFYKYAGWQVPDTILHWVFIRLAMMSVARIAVIPVQDLLGLDHSGRMNVPGTCDGNWRAG